MHEETRAESMRRVVTGQNPQGQSVLASDENIAPGETPLLPGAKFYSLWGADAVPSLPHDGTEPAFRTWFPSEGGFRFELIILPPDGTPRPSDLDLTAALAKTEELLPGLIGKMDPHHPGMHQTDTIDLIYVTEGACTLELESGAQIELKAGDAVVQRPAPCMAQPACGALRPADNLSWRETEA